MIQTEFQNQKNFGSLYDLLDLTSEVTKYFSQSPVESQKFFDPKFILSICWQKNLGFRNPQVPGAIFALDSQSIFFPLRFIQCYSDHIGMKKKIWSPLEPMHWPSSEGHSWNLKIFVFSTQINLPKYGQMVLCLFEFYRILATTVGCTVGMSK